MESKDISLKKKINIKPVFLNRSMATPVISLEF